MFIYIMESPFSNHNTVSFFLEPILNSHFKTYQQIISVSSIPEGPLAEMVSQISVPKLSKYQQLGSLISSNGYADHCVYAILRYPKKNGYKSMKFSDTFLGPDDIPSLFSYLNMHGYTIQNDTTTMMFHSNIQFGGVSNQRLSGNRKLICFASYTT